MNLVEGFCPSSGRHFERVQGIHSRPKLHVSTDGSGVVGHAGARLLADLADATGLTTAYSTALRPPRPRGTGHDPGRTATDLAVMLADGGEAIADLAVLRDQGEVSAKAFLTHIRTLREHGLNLRFSVGYAVTEQVRRAIRSLPKALWHPALEQNGTLRDGAEVAELTGMVDLAGYPVGTRITVRRERPHPGAQLSLFDHDEGLRHQIFLTDTPYSGGGSAQFLEVRHRGHATVEDHIRCGKNTGFGRFPSRHFDVNATWLELSLTAIDLLAWARVLLLDGELAAAEPKKLRYRLLHVAARFTRGGRRLRLRISATWPWRHELATAFHRLAALPRPVD